MELIVINDTKLKVMLTAEEVRKYDLASVGPESEDVRGALRPVFDQVKSKCGFDAGEGRVLVQYFPSRAGGCELFVTVFPQGGGRGGTKPPRKVWFSFDCVGALLGACRSLAARGLGSASRAYRAGARYVLCVDEYDALRARSDEFGTRESASAMEIYIPEHGTRMTGGDNDADALGKF